MIELPGKVRVLRFRNDEMRRLPPVGEGASRLDAKIKEDYPDWVIYETVYQYDRDYIYVILTESYLPVLSSVVKDKETGEFYITEEILSQ